MSYSDSITPEAASHTLWHFGYGGYEPGAFTQSLMVAIACADPSNTARLARVYPEYVEAYRLGTEMDGIETLHDIADSGSDAD